MSRIGKQPVVIPAGVTVLLNPGNELLVKGPKGELKRKLVDDLNIDVSAEMITVTRPSDLKRYKSLHGLTRTLINNMIIGVTDGYSKQLEINGTGYRAIKSGNKLTLTLGYSHPIEMFDPEGITSTVEGTNKITISGMNKEMVGQYAAEIRDKRRPEPYNAGKK
jgi:large subunit ribosomal protein L6